MDHLYHHDVYSDDTPDDVDDPATPYNASDTDHDHDDVPFPAPH